MRLLGLVTLIALSGCVGDHGAFAPQEQIKPLQPVVTIANPADVSKEDLKSVESRILDRFITSSNQSQQSFSGLGAQIAKGAEVVDAAVAKLNLEVKAIANTQVDVNTNVKAVATAVANTDVKVDTTVRLIDKLSLNVETQASAIADLKLKIEALTGAQVGLKNEMQQTTTSLNAGRDTYMQVNQVTKEWVDILRNENAANTRTIMIIFGGLCLLVTVVICGALELSRRRAERRADELKAKLLK